VGIYQLTAENGETLRVKNVGITWAILGRWVRERGELARVRGGLSLG